MSKAPVHKKPRGTGGSRAKRTALVKLRATSQRITWFLGTRFPERFPIVFVVGFPKSGTVWASQLVADCLDLPFPRYSYFPIGFPAVVHGHQTVWDSYPSGAYVVRDPRDVMVSAYFHTIRRVPDGDEASVPRDERRLLPGFQGKDRVRENLPGFIRASMKRPKSSPLNWPDHVKTYFNRRNDRIGLLVYEKLLSDGPTHLASAIEVITGEPADTERAAAAIDRYSFARQSGRKQGQEDRTSFLRKGQAGDWRNHFTREAAVILDEYCGELMLQLGYIQNRNWIDQCETA